MDRILGRGEPVRAAFFGDLGPGGETIEQVYGPQRIDIVRQATCLYPHIVTSRNIEEHLADLQDLDVIFSTWGMFRLTREQLRRLPKVRALFYAAGTVKHFAAELHERGITVVSGWAANAVPVAELTLGQILLANKGYFRNVREYDGTKPVSSLSRGRGNFDSTVSILGAGQIGRLLIGLLRPFDLRIAVFDPFLSYKNAEILGVEKVTLEKAFEIGNVVSNHLADVTETTRLLAGKLFESMPVDATFINTGRGATVAQNEMIEVLQKRSDLTALLDVTTPEPLPVDSPLRTMPNVWVSSHIAGAVGDEVGRLAEVVLEEFEAWRDGRPLRYIVTPRMLQTLA